MAVLAPQLHEKIRALYGFSRGTQAALSVSQPLIGALLAESNPQPARLALCLGATTAAYFAVLATNDLLDARLDRARFTNLRSYRGFDLDSAGGRHPLAQGQLTQSAATAWVAGLGATALALATLLNWVCVALLVTAALLQAAYCALACVTAFKCGLSGVMVALGGSVGWFAMGGEADQPLLWLFCLWLAAWEIGGRNLVNDWADVEEDAHLGIRTVPLVCGPRASGMLILTCLLLTTTAAVGLAVTAWPACHAMAISTLLTSAYALLTPALRLLHDPRPTTAMTVFNLASLYPVAMLLLVLAGAAAHGRHGG